MPLLNLGVILTLISLIPSTLSWGSLGHRTVAYVASQYLSPNASIYTTSLLNDQDISEAALWADKVRYIPIFRFTAGWHYIDAQDDPPRQCGVNLKRDCDADNGCIVSAIVNQTARIMRPQTNHVDKGQALRFLLHLFGDIHQPLHTEAEGRGGNEIDVLFGDKKTNLHAVWDTDILEKRVEGEDGDGDGDGEDEDQKATALAWAEALYATDPDPNASIAAECQDLTKARQCSLSYAEEANRWVCDYILKDDVDGVQGKDLSGDYYDGAVPIVDMLIGKAGRRLAAWLNALAAAAAAASESSLDVKQSVVRLSHDDNHDAEQVHLR